MSEPVERRTQKAAAPNRKQEPKHEMYTGSEPKLDTGPSPFERSRRIDCKQGGIPCTRTDAASARQKQKQKKNSFPFRRDSGRANVSSRRAESAPLNRTVPSMLVVVLATFVTQPSGGANTSQPTRAHASLARRSSHTLSHTSPTHIYLLAFHRTSSTSRPIATAIQEEGCACLAGLPNDVR